ncbi:zinc finger protein 391-like isoform X6 [Lytechinus pictus]
MANNEVTLDKEIKEEPYETYSIVKEEDLKDTLTEQNPLQEDKAEKPRGTAETSLEHGNLEGRLTGDGGSEALETHGQQEVDRDDSMVDGRSEEGWTEDNDDDKEMEVPQSSERTLICFIKEEPEDSTEGEAVGSNLHDTPSCSQQGGNPSMQSTSQGTGNTEEMSGDTSCDRSHGKHLPEDFPLVAVLRNQSDILSDNESSISEYDTVDYFHGHYSSGSAAVSHPDQGGLDSNKDTAIAREKGLSSQVYASGGDPNNPMYNPAEGKQFLCSFCNRGFTLVTSLTRHMQIHAEERPHECTFCKKRFQFSNGLKRHMRSHTGEKPYVCTICDKSFSERCHLKLHMAVHSGEKSQQCPFCEKTYARRTSLDAHIKTHTGEKPHQCVYCDMRFSRVDTLARHTRSHTGEKPYVCSFCNKTFSQTAHLTRHVRIHTGERPFNCASCGKTFSDKSRLVDHQKIHTGEKPFSCSVCEKKFGKKNDFKRHMRIHTGEKPYPCSVCGKSFRERSTLKVHMKTHAS